MDNDVEEIDGLTIQDEIEDDLEEVTLPSKTYHVKNGRIVEMTDEREAMIQAVDKILHTDRFIFVIYDEQYGNDLSELLGKDFGYAEVEIVRMLEEALYADDRVEDVIIDEVKQTDEVTLSVIGSVETIFGQLPIESEVLIDDTRRNSK
ncbi:DUF2634 domain-containing protein [Lentilactobacillus senioris]|uniref:DUF2634 domain-containing protein n=1 Tax=Lentilactobacillus senioris TaxID=931534 RepID=UPI002280EF40|nr:DUF2634 domain-containing protein [Lentilactobacillus senioris]MCY9807451.1 DUF2634 domain-containing protein [Lentilactobacillus senioris]